MQKHVQPSRRLQSSLWEKRRYRAIEQFMSAAATESDDGEAKNTALDALVVAHLAATFELEGDPHDRWQEYQENAAERLIVAWKKCSISDEDPLVRDELYAALDVLAVAHIATTFEWASGPFKW